MPETIPKRIEPAEVSEPPKEGIKSWVSSIRALIAAAINLSKQATSLEEPRVTHEILDRASTLLNRSDAIVELERTRLMSLGQHSQLGQDRIRRQRAGVYLRREGLHLLPA